MSQSDLELLTELLAEQERRNKYNTIASMFPDHGKYRRELYPKQLEFFKAGATHKERAFVAANRSGKTIAACTELVYHLTGNYPAWWEGRKFECPVDVWVVGLKNQDTKEILQTKLLGKSGEFGTGMIPADSILGKPPSKPGVPEGIELVRVQSKFGISTLTFKSCEQGRASFQGVERHIVWFDEEPPYNIYTEALTRTMKVPGCEEGGMIMLTFTPLSGMSETVLQFMPDGDPENCPKNKYVVQASWDDVPHLNQKEKEIMLAAYSPHEIEARSKGLPSLGSGSIYPIPESFITIEPFRIPDEWPRWYGMDFGWGKTACVWIAKDPSTNTHYLYDEYYRGQAEPAVHVEAIKRRGGDWMRGSSETAGYNQSDGTTTRSIYMGMGLLLSPANKAVDAGILKVYQMLSQGQLKVVSTCKNWFKEYRLYHRDEKGDIVKKKDHLLDATRYALMPTSFVESVNPEFDDDESMYTYTDPYSSPN